MAESSKSTPSQAATSQPAIHPSQDARRHHLRTTSSPTTTTISWTEKTCPRHQGAAAATTGCNTTTMLIRIITSTSEAEDSKRVPTTTAVDDRLVRGRRSSEGDDLYHSTCPKVGTKLRLVLSFFHLCIFFVFMYFHRGCCYLFILCFRTTQRVFFLVLGGGRGLIRTLSDTANNRASFFAFPTFFFLPLLPILF